MSECISKIAKQTLIFIFNAKIKCFKFALE